MAIYDLEDTRTGLQISVDLDSDPTEEDVANIFSQLREDGLAKVRQAPEYKTDESGNFIRNDRGKRVKQKAREYYAEHIPDALGIPRKNFNPDKGAPMGIRSKLDFFRQKTDQAALLKAEYGDENVTAINVGGDPKFLFKEKDEWRFVDPVGFDIGDVTADIAGDIIPTTASIIAGVAAIPSGPAGAALSAGAAQFASGLAQDMIARGLTPEVDFDSQDIVDRAGEAVMTTAVDYGTMKAGRLIPKGIFRKEGSDLAVQELKEINNVLKGGVPQVMMKGEASIGKLKEIADRYPEGAIAKTFEDARQQIGKLVDDELNPIGLSDDAARKILGEGLSTLARQSQDEMSRLRLVLDNLAAEKATLQLSKSTAKALEAKARKEATEAFNKALELRVKNLRAKVNVSPERSGLNLQQRLARQFVQREARGNQLFEEAYQNLANSSTNAGRLSRIFSGTKNDVILDIEDDVIAKLAPGAAAGVDVTLKKLDEIADQPVTFKQLNEIIQLIEEKTKRASITPGAQAGAYRRLGDKLRAERSRLLRQADPNARASFANANRFFRDDILPNREGAVYNAIKAEAGDSYSQAIKLAQAGRDFKLPRLVSGGTKVINDALSNPKAARDFLRSEGNTLEARKILREAFLSKKGLDAGKPFDASSLKFTKEDLDIAEVLYPKKIAGGFNRKRQDLEELMRFAASKKTQIDGMAADTFEKLMLASDEDVARQMKKIAKEEIATKAELNKIVSERIIKMMNKGELPLPSNQNGMEMFASGFLKSSPADIDLLMKRMLDEAPEMIPSMRLSIYNDVLARAGRGTDDAQMGRLGYQLWNPEKLESILRKEGPKLRKILGEQGFNQLDKMNKGLKRFSVARPSGEDEALKASAAASFGGISIFLSNISRNVKDRLVSVAFASEMALPFPVQKMLTAESYDRMLEGITKGLFMTSKGQQMLLQQAEADPEFRAWLTETYAQLMETSEGK